MAITWGAAPETCGTLLSCKDLAMKATESPYIGAYMAANQSIGDMLKFKPENAESAPSQNLPQGKTNGSGSFLA